MIRTKLLVLNLWILFITVSAATESVQPAGAQNRDLYWISYAQSDTEFFLMQIDSAGNITKAPTQIIFPQNVSYSFGTATTISRNGDDKINLWLPGKRVVIDKQTLQVLKVVRNGISSANWTSFQVTQKPQENFVVGLKQSAVEDDSCYPHHLQATAVSPRGVRKHSISVVSPDLCTGVIEFFCPGCGGAVSSDGKTLYWFTLYGDLFTVRTSLFIQGLDDSGQPEGSPTGMQFSYALTRERLKADVSNVLPQGMKFVVFATPFSPFRLYLQPVDATTNTIIGDKILLSRRSNRIEDLVIDPLGGFVVFACKKNNSDFLFFKAVDATGHLVGNTRILLRNRVVSGMDILKD